MSDCARCTRHPAGAEECDDHCRHRTADTGSLLCHVCRIDTRDALDAIAASWLLTDPETHTSQRSAVRGRERGVPGGVERLNWRSSTRLLVQGWCLVAAEDYHLRLPGDDTPALIEWLRRRWESHLHGHEAAVDIADELIDASRAGVRIAGLGEVGQRVPCQAPWGDGICGRTLLVDVHNPGLEVQCGRCRSVWTSARLLIVALSEGGDAWLDAEAVEVCLHVPGSTLRRWAKAGKVRRRGGLYAVADISGMRSA